MQKSKQNKNKNKNKNKTRDNYSATDAVTQLHSFAFHSNNFVGMIKDILTRPWASAIK
jgi:hypothetical protein